MAGTQFNKNKDTFPLWVQPPAALTAERRNMKIQVGKYILRSDQYSMWIEEEYIGKDKKGREKKDTRRVAGYATSFDNLLHQFVEHKHRASEAKTLAELLKELKQIAEDTEAIKKTALKEDFRQLRKIAKEVKEINK